MKIIQLTAENVKKLKVVDITPKGNVVRVTGKNGQGKTSVLDSIWWALAGKDGIQAVPIRKGAEEARIRVNLGEIIVERKFLPSGTTTLTVRNPVGAEPGTPDSKLPKYGSPQEMLDALMGELSFDPLAFMRMKPREQFDELRRISKLSVDIDKLDAENKLDFAKRTDVNRDLKAKRAQADGIVIQDGTPTEPVDEDEVLNKIQSAGEHNAAIETRKARREQTQRDANGKKAEGVRLRSDAASQRARAVERVSELERQLEAFKRDAEAQAAELDAKASDALAIAADLEKKIDSAEPLPAPMSVTDLRAELDAAKFTNTLVAKRGQRDAILSDAAKLEAQSKELTDRMAAREAEKVAAIQSAKMPIDGLGFGDGAITFNGLPLNQASDAEQLRVSVSIAMAKNPKLRVIRVRDGSLLDEDGGKMLAELAAQQDYQVWIEQVDSTGKIGIVMEGGQVASDNQVDEEMAVS